MCEGCWREAGSPTDWTQQTARFVELVHQLYRHHSTGGPLHTVLDDWNLDGEIQPRYDTDDDAATRTLCDELAAILNGWTVAQRYAAMAYAEGLIEPAGSRP